MVKWIEAKVVFDPMPRHLAAELIADAFATLGVSGVVVEDPDEQPDEPWDEHPAYRPKQHAVIGYFPDDPGTPARCRDLESALGRLEKSAGIRSRVAYRDIDEEDWAESWKAFFWPEKITPTFTIKPTWRSYRPQAHEIVLEIDPGMAFGTGTHPTTRLCIQALETHLRAGNTLLDVGTGSGILMVAAAKLGARRMAGIDIDPVAVRVAGENLRRNGVPEDRFSLHPGELAAQPQGRFDLVVANILSEVIVALLDDVPVVLTPGGVFIASGIVLNNAPRVRSKMTAVGFAIIEERSLDGWVMLAGRLDRSGGDP